MNQQEQTQHSLSDEKVEEEIQRNGVKLLQLTQGSQLVDAIERCDGDPGDY